MMVFHCPECGGHYRDEDGCRQKFEAMLALEFSDPAFGRVHFLTVTAYMLQHPTRLSRRGWLAMRDLLSRHLRDGHGVEDIKVGVRRAGVSAAKGWKIKADGTTFHEAIGLDWPLTAADVDPSDSVRYGAGVQAWAEAALERSESLPVS